MIRHLSLVWNMFLYNVKRELEYKASVIGGVGTDVAYYAVHLILFEVIYSQVPTIGEFGRPQMHIFILTFFFTENLWDFLFGLNLGRIPTYVTQGDLDLILIKPIDSQFFVSFRYYRLSNLINAVLISTGLIWALHHHGFELTPIRIFLYLVLCLNGVIIIYIIDFFCNVLVFWLRKFTHARWLWHEIIKITHRPDAIYPPALIRIMWFLPPLIFVNSIPTRVLIMNYPLHKLWPVPFITGTALYLTHRAWLYGLKRYESASS